MRRVLSILALLTLGFSPLCGASFDAKYESLTLDNGLKVLLVRDASVPIVALAIQYHVGSNRETTGKTGFAHLFEHLMFQRSENMPRNYFFNNIAKLGGTFNGSTNFDGTLYYEQVPRDALEKVLWMESERMGYFMNTVTQKGLEREIDIVSNEKRQNYDNKAYGQLQPILSAELFPAGHPYSWTVIGKIPDLRNASLEDVKAFHDSYYVPNNATLVLSGDFDVSLAKRLVTKYFGEIKRGPQIEKPKPENIRLSEGKRIYFEDSYAPVAMIDVIYPTVDIKNKDVYAINAFLDAFASGKSSPLYKCLITDKHLASYASGYSSSREIAGYSTLAVIAKDGVGLNDIQKAITEAFSVFEKNGYDPAALRKYKLVSERNAYYTVSTTLGKAMSLATNNEFAGNPLQVKTDLKEINALTVADVMRAYEKYFKNKPSLSISIVPKGHKELAIDGARAANLAEEKVDEQKMRSAEGAIVDDAEYVKTPSSFDRSHEPDYLSNSPSITSPSVWSKKLSNGMIVNGITRNGVPLVQYELVIKGGMLLDPAGKMGLAYVTALMLNEGTKTRTAEQLSRDLSQLASTLNISASSDAISMSGFSTATTFPESVAILEDIVLNPRFEATSLERVKSKIRSEMLQDKRSPDTIARSASRKLLYGSDSRLAYPSYGTEASLSAITIEDVREFYNKYVSPQAAYFNVVGDADLTKCADALDGLSKRWKGSEIDIPHLIVKEPKTTGKIYFIDNPGAQQSMVRFSRIFVPYESPDYYPFEIVNYMLGNGSNGMLFDILRLKKGYTYGAFSTLDNSLELNTFDAYASIQASVTSEALVEFRRILGSYGDAFSPETLSATQGAITRSRAAAFERLDSLSDILRMISLYDRPKDYLAREEQILKGIRLSEAKDVIARKLNLDDFVIVVVGDAKTQLKRIDGAILMEQ